MNLGQHDVFVRVDPFGLEDADAVELRLARVQGIEADAFGGIETIAPIE
jgi:hypothetical protein